MGRRGPPPKPTAQKQLEGTYRADRAVPDEMSLPDGMPRRPDWLDAEGRREWDRVVPQLAAIRILSEVDAGMLADYCAAHSLAVKATKKYQREGLTVKVNGQTQRHPMLMVAKEARAQARLLAAEFGLSPSSRSRISNPEKGDGLTEANERMAAASKGPVDPDEQFLMRPRQLKVINGGPAPAPASSAAVSDTPKDPA